MQADDRRKLAKRKQRIRYRLRERRWKEQPRRMLKASNIRYEMAGRTRAVGAGGIGAIHTMVRRLGLTRAIDEEIHLLKRHPPHFSTAAYTCKGRNDMAENYDVDEVIRSIQLGESDLFLKVIEKWHVQVRASICASVSDPDDADDLAQQTFIYAFERISDYSLKTNFLAWLRAIARNLVLDYHDRNRTRRAAFSRYLRQEIARRASEISGTHAADSRLELLGHCIDGLAKKQRLLLRLAHARRSTLDDLASELGRTGRAIRKQLSRLHGLLRKCVEQQLAAKGVTLG